MKTCPDCNVAKSPEQFCEYRSRRYLCKECYRIRMARYRKSESGKEYARQYAKERYKKFRHKASARGKVAWAIKSGALIKPTCCSACLTETAIFGHHEDYDKPLEVMWLCRPCHMDKHGKLADKSLIGRKIQ